LAPVAAAAAASVSEASPGEEGEVADADDGFEEGAVVSERTKVNDTNALTHTKVVSPTYTH
jgi:hypothetical protein